MIRRNLSGIYIFDQFEGEDKKQPTCFEDCTKAKQKEWLDSLDEKSLKSLAIKLADTIKIIGEQFDLMAN